MEVNKDIYWYIFQFFFDFLINKNVNQVAEIVNDTYGAEAGFKRKLDL